MWDEKGDNLLLTQKCYYSANSHVNEKKDYSITSGSVETRDAGIVIFISVASIKTSDKFLSIPAGK